MYFRRNTNFILLILLNQVQITFIIIVSGLYLFRISITIIFISMSRKIRNLCSESKKINKNTQNIILMNSIQEVRIVYS